MSIRKDVVRVVKLKEFHSRVDQLLTPADRDYFFYALKEYNTYKSVAKLMLALNSCLDTPEKLDLLPSIRELIPKHDRRKFDNLAPYNRMAHPLVLQTHPSSPSATAADTTIERDESGRNGAKTEGKDDRSVEKHDPPGVMFGAVKTVFLQRESCKESFGFSIRGGREHDIGIFVSLVEPFSLAEGCGLMAGDKILSVNGFSFKNITHQSAVLILKSHNQLQISVVSVGHVPGLPRERKSLIWVDTTGKPVNEEKTNELSNSIEEDHRGSDRLLESSDKHKVVLSVEKEQPLGFSVRGGREFSLGIFVSQIDADSPAEQSGLKAGDQIVAVNGHSFASLLHHEAVAILRAYTTLVITVRSLGRLPLLVSEDKDDVDGDTPSPPITHTTSHRQQHTHKTDHTHNDHTHSNIQHQKRWTNWKKSVSRRSQSVREFLRPRSLYTQHHHNIHKHHQVPRSHSYRHSHQFPPRHSHQDLVPQSRPRTESDGALNHYAKPHGTTHSTSSPRQRLSKPTHLDPLVLNGTSPSPPSAPQKDHTRPQQHLSSQDLKGHTGGGDERESVGMFFRYGVGTQLMLATTSSSARALMEDSARRYLDSEEMTALTERLREYETNGGVEDFAEFLVTLLDTPTKMQLLSDIRSVINPTDLVSFDEIVSPHEIAALQKRASFRKTTPTTTVATPTNTLAIPNTMVTPTITEATPTKAPETTAGSRGRGSGGNGERTRRVGLTDSQRSINNNMSVRFDDRDSEREVILERRSCDRDDDGRQDSGGRVGETSVRDRVREEEREVIREQVNTNEEDMIEQQDGEHGEREGDTLEVVEEEDEDEGDESRNDEREREEVVQEDVKDEDFLEPATTQEKYNLVLYEIQNRQGQGSLHRAVVEEGGLGSPHIGAFGTEPVTELVTRATDEEPSMVGMQTRESFLEWNEDYESDHTPSRSPVIIEMAKSAHRLGLTITGGIDTSSPEVIITDVKEDGAAGIDGFLKPGFEILQVDGVRIQGLPHDSAARELAAAFRSDRPTIELVVIPV